MRPDMESYGNWQPLKDLGEGGQSTVYLARSPRRVSARQESDSIVMSALRSSIIGNDAQMFTNAVVNLARDDSPAELGALKVFKLRVGGAPAVERLKREIDVLRDARPNLPKLLDANPDDQWMVTEYFQHGTLFDSPNRYQGAAVAALKAFRSLVETVDLSLHHDSIVHRDLKPANIFIGDDGNLIPGDFGIVFLPHDAGRITVLHERVGPSDYMPPWADSVGDDLDDIEPNFDVYMLGKLLWCMVAGRLRLRREHHRAPEFDLTKFFPESIEQMSFVNRILDRCLVERPEKCLSSAQDLLEVVDENLAMIERNSPYADEHGKLVLRCQVCGVGRYKELATQSFVNQNVADEMGRIVATLKLRIFYCDVCKHAAYFAPNFPDEAANKGWK